ncbi:MAG: HEAT repeat domain-containing protein [Thermodesulfovibrionales bacterium]|nr:HEAT repeat domain-containing protein [Thermodesulfovibrionales bacterium]
MLRMKFIALLILVFCFQIAGLDISWGYDLNKIQAALNSKDWQVRLSTVEKLREFNDKRSLQFLLEVAGARGEYWPVKIKAIQLLGERADNEAIPVLLEIYNDIFLHSECPSIKSYTATALGNFKNNEQVFKALLAGIDDPELLIRESSIEALGRIGNPKATEHLIKLLDDKSFAIKHSVIKALANIGDKKALPYLNKILESDPDPVIRDIVFSAIEKIN